MNVTLARMRTTLIAVLLCAVSLVLPCGHAQQSEALRRQFLEFKAKAEQGDAQSQSNLGLCYAQGRGVPLEAMLEEKLQSEPVKAEARGSGGDSSAIGVTSDLRPARLKGEHDEQGAIPPTRAEGPCRRANLGPTGPA